MINCMAILKCCKDDQEEKLNSVNDFPIKEQQCITHQIEDKVININKNSQQGMNVFKIESTLNDQRKIKPQSNVSFSFTSSSNYSESSLSLSDKSIKINKRKKHNKSGHVIEGNVTFFGDAQGKSLLNESLKQLQFSYDDIETTKFNTNNKKNSLSESKDQITSKIVIEQFRNDDNTMTKNKDQVNNEIVTRMTQTSNGRTPFSNEIDSNQINESTHYLKAKSKQSEHKEPMSNLIVDLIEQNQFKLSVNQNEELQPLFLSKRISRCSFKNFKDNKIIINNSSGSFLPKTIVIDTKGIEEGLRNKRDGFAHFGFDQMDGQTINDVIVDKQALVNGNGGNICEEYKQSTLFSIFYDTNCQKFFFQPKKNRAKQMVKVYFNIILPFCFISNQTIEINSTIIILEPNAKDNTIAIKINQNNAITVTKSKQVSFNKTLNGIELKSPPSDVSSICALHYEKGKELWVLVPQSINIWLNVNCKRSLEQSTLIKYGNEAIIKVALIQ